MRKRSLSPLGETEMEVLHHVWALSRASVADVHALILETRDVAYTTVMTVMRKLADKGYLSFEKDGTTYVYSAAKSPEDVKASLVGDLMDKVFHGRPAGLVQALVQHETLSDEQRKQLERLVEELEADDESRG